MKTLVFTGFHKANVEKHMGFEALNGNPGPKHCVFSHFLGGGSKRAFLGPWGRRDGVLEEREKTLTRLTVKGRRTPNPKP